MVRAPYPYTKEIVHYYTEYDSDYNGSPIQTYSYRLEVNDEAYTLALPQEILDFQPTVGTNNRPVRASSPYTPPAEEEIGGGDEEYDEGYEVGYEDGYAAGQTDAENDAYYEGALALGATHERSVFFTVIPAAKSGITAAVILGVGRAIGETLAVSVIVGNSPVIPESVLDMARTMTTNIVLEMGYAEGLHREALIATAVVLFVFILIINLLFSLLKRKGGKA